MPISLQGAEGKEEVVEEHRPGQQKGCRAGHFKKEGWGSRYTLQKYNVVAVFGS